MPPTVDHRRPVPPRAVAALTVWRLAIAACAAIGLVAAIRDSSSLGVALQALSQLASLGAVIVYLGLAAYPFATGMRFHEPRSPWWRGTMAATLVLVMIVFQTLLSGDLTATRSIFEHLVTPLVVLADVLLVGRDVANAHWWLPLTWLALPLVYLGYYNLAQLDVYESDFSLRFDKSEFWGYFPGFIGGLLVAGFAILAVGRLRASSGSRREQPAQHPAEQPASGGG